MTNGVDGDAFWIVTEHGHRADYVRNIEANPRVRVRSGRKWRAGTAQPVDEDPEARLAKEAQAKSYDARADASFADGPKAAGTGDKYVRDPVFLASVLFLVGISGHFALRQARYGLIGIGTLILMFAVVAAARPTRPRAACDTRVFRQLKGATT